MRSSFQAACLHPCLCFIKPVQLEDAGLHHGLYLLFCISTANNALLVSLKVLQLEKNHKLE